MIRDEAKQWLEINTKSEDFYTLLGMSNSRSRRTFGERGYVFAQIGINADMCSVNCKFCSMASSHYSLDNRWEKTADEIVEEAQRLAQQNINALFLMTTADYSVARFIEIGRAVRNVLPQKVDLVANIGDFNRETAQELKAAGFTGAYHIRRLREGTDTLAAPETRMQTIQHIIDAGLELYYCIEPIGSEHTYDEILDELFFAKTLPINIMAVMRRTPVAGTPLSHIAQIDAMELSKIAAVANLVIEPSVSMNVHEPLQMSLLAGVNQLYAESGANPRDTVSKTETSRGFTPDMAWAMLAEAGYANSK